MMEDKNRLFPLLVLGAALTFFLLATVFYSLLPGVVESRVIAAVSAKAGLSHFSLRVRSIGFTGADITDVRLAEAGADGPAIDSIRLEYSPIGLVRGRIEQIIVSGVSLSLNYQAPVFGIDGLELSLLADGSQGAGSSFPALPLSIGAILVHNAAVTCRYQNIRLQWPLEMTIVPNSGMTGIERFLIQVSPRTQRLLIAGSLDGLRKGARVSLSGDGLQLERLSSLAAIFPGLRLHGELDMGAQATLALAPFSVTSVSAFCKLRPTDIGYRGLSISPPPHVEKTSSLIHLRLLGDNLNEWKIDASPFMVDFPGGRMLTEAVCSVKATEAGVAAEAEARSTVSAVTRELGNPLGIDAALPPMRWSLSATYAGKTGWQARMNGRIDTEAFDRKQVLQIGRTSLWMGPPEITASAEATAGEILASYWLQVPGVSVQQDKTRASFPMITLSGTATRSPGGSGKDALGFSIEIPQVRLVSGTVSGLLPEGLRISGDWRPSSQGKTGVTGLMAFSGGSLAVASHKVSAAGIAGNIPFQWPPAGKAASGSFSSASINWEKRALGGVNFSLRQEGDGVAFSGKYESLLMPGLAVQMTGSADHLLDDWRAGVKVRLPAYHLPEKTDLGRIHPAAAGSMFRGDVHLAADMELSAADRRASLSMGIRNAALQMPEMKVTLDGISTELDFPDAVSLRSAPKQRVHVSRVSVGDIEATDFDADFQIEGLSTLFVEQSRFNWCRGNVSTQAFRISPGVHDYRLTLYCDRLNLADILRQFGAAKADGEGAVNGRVPVVFSEGKLSFQDGFLYSTPGAGGSIQVTQTQALTQGMSPDSPQYMQMEIAREALKHFNYQWVKMNLVTEGKDLLMGLTFDGKPAGELPFTYRRETGSFVRVATEAKGSVFQGIRLDVNFRLPLDDILKYKEILNLMK